MDRKSGCRRTGARRAAGFNNLHPVAGRSLVHTEKHWHIKALVDQLFLPRTGGFTPGVDTFYTSARLPWISSGITRTRSTPSCWLIFSCTSADTGPAQSMML